MRKKRNFVFVFAFCVIVIVLSIILMAGKSSAVQDPTVVTKKGEILHVYANDRPDGSTGHMLVVRFEDKEYDYTVKLHDDTAVMDAAGKKLDFTDLRKGQMIEASLPYEVIHSGFTDPVNHLTTEATFSHCYEIIILD